MYEFRVQEKDLGWTFKLGNCWPKITLRAIRLDDVTKEKCRQKKEEDEGVQHFLKRGKGSKGE